jgi:hypothetical protein
MAKPSITSAIIQVSGALIFFFVVVFGCKFFYEEVTRPIPNTATRIEYNAERNYTIFEVEGMPCLQLSNSHGGSVTCDWSQWEGQ